MIKPGDIIKHDRFMDVAFYVSNVDPLIYNEIAITGVWLNQGFTKSWVINKTHVMLNISKDKLSEWSYCEGPYAECFRHEKWSKYDA
jgi:hypothetical protein